MNAITKQYFFNASTMQAWHGSLILLGVDF